MLTVNSKADVRKALEEKKWINGKGQALSIENMSLPHIHNCITFLEEGEFTKNGGRVIKLPRILREVADKYLHLFREEVSSRET